MFRASEKNWHSRVNINNGNHAATTAATGNTMHDMVWKPIFFRTAGAPTPKIENVWLAGRQSSQ
jgi:hypothetical protein